MLCSCPAIRYGVHVNIGLEVGLDRTVQSVCGGVWGHGGWGGGA